MIKKLWAILGMLFLLLATGFMNEVDYFGMNLFLGFIGTVASLLLCGACWWKAGGFENNGY